MFYELDPKQLAFPPEGSVVAQQYVQPSVYSQPAVVHQVSSHQFPEVPFQNFATEHHPFLGRISRAEINMCGDLRDAERGWRNDEINCGRRLVRFRAAWDGSVVNTLFDFISKAEYDPNDKGTFTVSCIYWKEANHFCLTSVDYILLIEMLLKIDFKVEERNRVRRNIEPFSPTTVSKTNPDTFEFYDRLMKYDTPRPRNIEKDIKVFPWSTLEAGLKKIAIKYSATIYDKARKMV
ncbi:hypothetical protein BDF14DRAFT_1785102 [Spinellus fusiger]|nr:hypothetical protein BDF14DRAFT_1785102 [Spinellus fusiger]